MPKAPAKYEESIHYNGQAVAKFYPVAHYYSVTDDGYVDPLTGKPRKLVNQRMGGGTSLTGVMSKGQGLMLYPMYEMRKYLKQFFRTNTIEDFFDSNMTIEDLLKEGCNAHVKKSDRGKNVGTDAHAWVESYLREALSVQDELGITTMNELIAKRTEYNQEFDCPEIPEIEEVAVRLRKSYIDIFKAVKPKNVEEYMTLPKLLFQDAEIQHALWIEASMLHRSTVAAKKWFELHDVYVHGTEDTVYSRKLQVCGKYDADISVTCSERCNWCYLNGDEELVNDIVNQEGTGHTFTGRYIADFKSTNASRDAPKGIYPEYLAQCGVYDIAKTEEFPDIVYDGHLILNGSKNEPKYDTNGQPISNIPGKPYSPFNTHFSFERDRNRAWAMTLADVKEFMYDAGKEVKGSA